MQTYSSDEQDLRDESRKAWYCIYTKPRQEDALCRKLSDIADIETLNPKLKRKKLIRGKHSEVVEEFFPCYVFARFDPRKYHHMITYTRGVRRIVGNSLGLPYIVDESIINMIKEKMSDGYIAIDYPRLVEGEEVSITEGPMKGMKGLFSQELKSQDRVLILLNTIKYQAKVEIEADYVVKA